MRRSVSFVAVVQFLAEDKRESDNVSSSTVWEVGCRRASIDVGGGRVPSLSELGWSKVVACDDRRYLPSRDVYVGCVSSALTWRAVCEWGQHAGEGLVVGAEFTGRVQRLTNRWQCQRMTGVVLVGRGRWNRRRLGDGTATPDVVCQFLDAL